MNKKERVAEPYDSRVYDAEDNARECYCSDYHVDCSLPDDAAQVSKIADWILKKAGIKDEPIPVIRISDKVDLDGERTGAFIDGIITLSRNGGLCPFVLCHELAHWNTPDDHGPDFCAKMLRLIEAALDKDAAAVLRDWYDCCRVSYDPVAHYMPAPYLDAVKESPPPLYIRKTSGRYSVAETATIFDAAMALAKIKHGETLSSPDSTETFLKLKIGHLEHEVFCVIFLDNRHRVIKFEEMFRGTIDGTSVYPREIVKEALSCNAAAIILAHNHPSGTPEPSQADERITKRLKAACELIDVRVLDHLIIGSNKCVSLAQRGLL